MNIDTKLMDFPVKPHPKHPGRVLVTGKYGEEIRCHDTAVDPRESWQVDRFIKDYLATFNDYRFSDEFNPNHEAAICEDIRARGLGLIAQHNGHAGKPPSPSGAAAKPVVRRMSDVQTEEINWLWPSWIPAGMLTVLDGDPGRGKSTLTCDLAARVTRGWAMPPDASNSKSVAPADVLFLSAEDDPSRTIRPRLLAAGADVARVHVLDAMQLDEDDQRPPVLPYDIPVIEQTIGEADIRLLVIDPLMAFLDGEVNAHRDQDVRRVLYQLKLLAERTGAAVLLVRHLNKMAGGPAMYRGGGSIGITGAARSALIVGGHPQDGDQNVLAAVKANLGPMPLALPYTLESAGAVARVVWDEECDLQPDEILATGKRPRPAEACADLLRSLLEDGPRESEEVERLCLAAGFGQKAFKNARHLANVEANRKGFGPGGKWLMRLSDTPESHRGP